MRITDEAKVILEKMLEEEKQNCISFFLQDAGCHKRLCMDFISVSDGDQINGLFVQMDDQTAAMLQDIILDADNGNLMIASTAPAGGCGGGCGGCGGSCGEDCGCDGGCC